MAIKRDLTKIVNKLVYGDEKPFKLHEVTHVFMTRNASTEMSRLVAQAAARYSK